MNPFIFLAMTMLKGGAPPPPIVPVQPVTPTVSYVPPPPPAIARAEYQPISVVPPTVPFAPPQYVTVQVPETPLPGGVLRQIYKVRF